MIDLIAAAGIGGIIGAGIMAWRTAGKVTDQSGDASTIRDLEEENEIVSYAAQSWAAQAGEAERAYTRCADALTTTQRKLSDIRNIVGPTHGLRRGRLGQIAAVLDGDV